MSRKDNFFTNKNLISQLISYRAKKAKGNHDLLISKSYLKQKNTQIYKDKDIIYSIMPPHRKWITLGKKYRKNGVFFLDNSVKVNKKRLEFTIERDRKKRIKPRYYRKLQIYLIKQKVRFFFYKKLKIKPPNIKPIPKNSKTLRPLCSYCLSDNLILKEINSYLTKKFDILFFDCSYAFRAKKNHTSVPTHHDTIVKIKEYLHNHKEKQIYVAECDLQKFFDTINHKVIKESYKKAISDKRIIIPNKIKKRISKIINEYLESYNFIDNVKSLENIPDFKDKYGNKTFGWVKEKDLIDLYGKNYKDEKLGIPQGGPLSGLFANLVQNQVDEAIIKLNDPDLLYLRYCDDMIMLHIDKNKLATAYTLYQEKIKENKLFIHQPSDINNRWYSRNFYSEKSKAPYEWGDSSLKKVPWISFVGYQIHYSGEIRVRKASIKKEQTKQHKLINKTIGDIKKYGMKKTLEEIKESVSKRLIGMSVGRIFLYDLKNNSSLCWTSGFRELTKNKYSLYEMKLLDKSRKKAYGELCKFLNTLPKEKKQVQDNEDKKVTRQIIYSGKPYSYYYWLESKGEDDDDN